LPGSLAAGCGVTTTLIRGFADGLASACFAAAFAAGFLTAGFVVTVPLAVNPLETGFWPEVCLAAAGFDLVSRALDCFAASFLAVAAPAPLAFRAVSLAVPGLRAGDRDAVAFWVAPFIAARLVPEPPVRAVFGLVLWSGVAFGRETLTRPRMARPDDRPFAAAFTVARRVDLLCEVEAMGTTLVTVVTW